MNHTPPLLRRAALLPGESLASLLARLEQLNHYSERSILQSLCTDAFGRRRIGTPTTTKAFLRLANLTLLPAATLYAASHHRFAHALAHPAVQSDTLDLDGAELPLLPHGFCLKHLRPERQATYCPACLAGQPYHRLVWTPRYVAACVRHACLLLSECPRCGAATAVRDIAAGQCSQCEFNLAEAAAPSLRGDEWGLFTQEVLANWLTAEPLPPSAWADTLPPHPPNQLLRLIDGLISGTKQAGDSWAFLHGAPPEDEAATLEMYQAFATAMRGLVNWPRGFFGFLDAYRSLREQQGHRGFGKGLWPITGLWMERIWQPPAFGWVQDAYEQYLAEQPLSLAIIKSRRYQNNPDLASRFDYMPIIEAQQVLGITRRTINRLVSEGQLQGAEMHSPASRLKVVRRADVLALHERWRTAITLDEAAERLGLRAEATAELVRMGLLTAERGPTADGTSIWHLRPQSVEALLGAVAAHVHDPAKIKVSAMDIVTAAKKVSAVGLNLAGIIARVAAGNLPVYHAAGQPLRLGRLRFTERAIAASIQQVKDENGWISRREARRRLKVEESTLAKWARAGLLTPITIGSAQYFHRDELEEFIGGHLSARQAAEYLDIGRDVIYHWVREGRITPVENGGGGTKEWKHHLFRRADVERLSLAHSWTAKQMAAYHGVTRPYIYAWVRKGKLVPIPGTEFGTRGQLLFAPPSEPNFSDYEAEEPYTFLSWHRAEAAEERYGWLRLEEVARRMSVGTTTMAHWVTRDLLRPIAQCGQRLYFDAAAADAFVAGHVLVPEAARILGITDGNLAYRVKRGDIEAVSGPPIDGGPYYLLRRADVEAEAARRREEFYTAEQVAEHLRITPKHVYRLVSQGILRPAADAPTDGRSRFLFDALPERPDAAKSDRPSRDSQVADTQHGTPKGEKP